MKPVNYVALNAVTTSQSSAPIPTQFAIAGSLQVVATGTIAGAVKFQFSNDKVQAPQFPTNWSDIISATVTLTGTAGAFAIPKIDLAYEYVQVVFTASGGSGTVTATYKGIDF